MAVACTILVHGCGGSGGTSPSPPAPPPPQPPVSPDWDLSVNTADVVAPISPALIGYYDLSGVLFDYANIPGLVAEMRAVGFASPDSAGADWRIGLGRWEISTEIFDALTNGTVCPNFLPENQSAFASDLALLASRDWFTFTDGSPVMEADIGDSRYALDYVRSAIDMAAAFGATPYVSIDLMPRALSINQTPNRLICNATFTNGVSNNEPANPAVFAKAVAGAVQRVVEGTGTGLGNDRPRAVQYWEIWNEPELDLFWEPTLIADPTSFFDMAVAALIELDAYRRATTAVNGQAIKIGLGSFVSAGSAVATIQNFDTANIPMDFISFHAYNDDPLVTVDAIQQVATELQNSTNYQTIELVLSEWGPNLATRAGDQQYASSMDPALHAVTVVALGATAGLDRSHNAIIYDFFSGVALGLIDHAGTPRPLYRAFELMAKLTTGNSEQLAVQGIADGRLDAGMGAVLVAREAQTGMLRVLLVNRNTSSRTVRLTLDGATAIPTGLYVFDASTSPADNLQMVPVAESTFTLPARSVAVAEF